MEILKRLMLVYYDMNDIYSKLFELEITGQKDSEFFLQLIIILKSKILEEKQLFKLLYDSSEYNMVCDYISKEDNPLFLRLCNYMNWYENTNIEIYEDDSEDIVMELESLSKASKLYSACNKNIFLIYLSFLQECIGSDEMLREGLLNLKYYNSFTKCEMEDVLINNNFNVGEENYVDLYLVARNLDINIKLRDEIILDSHLNVIINMIKTLLSISDEDRQVLDKMVLAVNAECLLKACLALLSDRDYKKIRNKVFEMINELSNDSNCISVSIVNSYIDNRKLYKSRVKKLSMGNICD